ncbi:hypothetical protein, partial [Oceanidesulfovibrio marinus]
MAVEDDDRKEADGAQALEQLAPAEVVAAEWRRAVQVEQRQPTSKARVQQRPRRQAQGDDTNKHEAGGVDSGEQDLPRFEVTVRQYAGAAGKGRAHAVGAG